MLATSPSVVPNASAKPAPSAGWSWLISSGWFGFDFTLKRGASGYMTKESAPEELVGAIKKVLAGGRYVSPSLAEKLATYLSADGQKPPQEKLSDREFQVLRLIASGKIVSEIAKELSLSVKTISTYRSRILEKMGMKNNAELMHYAMQHQLVE